MCAARLVEQYIGMIESRDEIVGMVGMVGKVDMVGSMGGWHGWDGGDGTVRPLWGCAVHDSNPIHIDSDPATRTYIAILRPRSKPDLS